MNTEKENNAIWFAKKFSQLTDKQFETFCNRMQNECQNDTDYTEVSQILCSLKAIRNMKGDCVNGLE